MIATLTRRSFLQVATTTAAALGLPAAVRAFEEPLVVTRPAEWVVDKGAYYEIWIPKLKKLAKEHFDKPCVIFFEWGGSFSQCSVVGFVSVYGQQSVISECRIDAHNCRSLRSDRKSVLTLEEGSKDIVLLSSEICFDSDKHTALAVGAGSAPPFGFGG